MSRPYNLASICWIVGGLFCWFAHEHIAGALLFIAAGVWFREDGRGGLDG
jgi:hypothetical protein